MPSDEQKPIDAMVKRAEVHLPTWVKVAVVAAYFLPLIAIAVATIVMFDG